MDPDTSEASERQLELAREQGDAYGRALKYMAEEVAHDGGEQENGHYKIGYAVEEAEGMYEFADGELKWRDPAEQENLHLEVSVRDAADGRFVPCTKVQATLVDPDGGEHGPWDLGMLWHPMLYHYGRNVSVPVDGTYSLRVRVEPPQFMRHDEVNGKRFTEVAEVTFDDVQVERGSD